MVYFLKQINSFINRGLAFMASCCLLVMVFLTVGEMVLRVFGTPMSGIVEVIGWLAATITASALGYTQIHKGHVAINLLIAIPMWIAIGYISLILILRAIDALPFT